MAGINAVFRSLVAKRINPVKAWITDFQAAIVDVGMSVIPNTDLFSPHAHQAFNVVGVLGQLGDTC